MPRSVAVKVRGSHSLSSGGGLWRTELSFRRDQAFLPLEVLAEILGGGAGSRLHQALVLKRHFALSVDADYLAERDLADDLGVYAAARSGVAVPDLQAAMTPNCTR